jgi:hypothetical protein
VDEAKNHRPAKGDAIIASRVRHLGCAAAFCLAGTAQAATGYVRVDQIGYEAGLPMRAYVMSASPLNGEVQRRERRRPGGRRRHGRRQAR